MLSYDKLKDRSRDFLAATGFTLEEVHNLLPAFRAAYDNRYPPARTRDGKARRRPTGGGAKGALPNGEDTLLFILVYPQPTPLQTMPAVPFQLSQPQANCWSPQGLPVWQQALGDSGWAPERDASRVAHRQVVREGAPDFTLEGTARRRQRPAAKALPTAHYSGKKTTPTDKTILLVNTNTGKGVYRGPTVAGKTPDKQATDEAAIAYPLTATRDQDPGFQGYAPAGVLTRQPHTSRKAKH